MSRNPEKVSDVLALVRKLLDAAKPENAIELIQKQGTRSAELTNAHGVALMRNGDAAKAVEVYHSLCINESGFSIRQNVPTTIKVNYATALLLANNVTGCLATLREINEKNNPNVLKLRAAINRWRRSLSWWQRLAFAWYGAEPNRPVPLDFPPGELIGQHQLRPAASRFMR